ncbi:uncharacterized protein LOC111883470 [Lactuca sativa]|uniref:uncharacterized protein LOC111883470 n=1 Tax=Lactuca sativa TaxID=4236 RepID=UPI000CD84739|nr:uncharacterized protein LOC111883470 [Lactuca sativa]
MREPFLEHFFPRSKVAKLKKDIENFEQQPCESLYEAWDRYNRLIRNCPQNDLNEQQEVSIFYDEVNMMTRKLLDSQGPLTKKNHDEIKELIEEFSKNSREYHNPRHDEAKCIRSGTFEDMEVVLTMLNTMDRRVTKMDQSIHAIHVGCVRCNGPHLTKYCHLEENENKKDQVYYSNGDKYDEDWRKPKKEWFPYDEYKKQKDENFRGTGQGFYQKKQPQPEKKVDLESMLTRFTEASEKRNDETNAVIRDQQILMRDQQALLRNHQASIQNIEAQLRQLTTLVNERLSPQNSR